jgi:hypothetical protein
MLKLLLKESKDCLARLLAMVGAMTLAGDGEILRLAAAGKFTLAGSPCTVRVPGIIGIVDRQKRCCR